MNKNNLATRKVVPVNSQSSPELIFREKISDINLKNVVRKLSVMFSCFKDATPEELEQTMFRHCVQQEGRHTMRLSAINEDVFISFTISTKGGME